MFMIVRKETINMPEDYSVQRGRGDGRRWDGVERRRGGGRRWYDRRRRRPRFYYLPFPFFFGPRHRCEWYDRYGRCCDRYGRCHYRNPYPRYYQGNPEMDWEDAQMEEPMLMAGVDDDMYYEE